VLSPREARPDTDRLSQMSACRRVATTDVTVVGVSCSGW
jgi:hypothetical protein